MDGRRIILKGSAARNESGTWWLDTWGDGEGLVVAMKCANGHISTLFARRDGSPDSDHHRILDDGSVHPSVVCPRDGCTFHEWVQLADWSPLGDGDGPSSEAA